MLRPLGPRAAQVFCALAITVAMVVPSTAQADPGAANGPDWAFGHPAGEPVLASVSALSLLAALLPQQATAWEPSSERAHGESYGVASDFTGSVIGTFWQLSGGYGLEVFYYRNNAAEDPYGRAWRSTLVDVEAVLLSLGMTYGLKRLTGRCRPRAWQARDVGSGRCDPAAPEHDAFPSGHTSTVGAVAGTRLVLALRSSGASGPRFASFAFAETATVATGVLRVLAGAHSWEDVLGGLVVSHGAAALVAFAHPMDEVPSDPSRSGSPVPPAGPTWLSWTGRW